KMKDVKIVACCDVAPDRVKAFAVKWKIPVTYTDYRVMLEKEKLDGVVNVTPDALHAPISIAVAEHGLPIFCEKPLASNLADAQSMLAAVKQHHVINMVNFSYRNSCGLQAAAALVRTGALGHIRHVESSYLQSWLVSHAWGDWKTDPSKLWRLSTSHGSTGVLGDIGVHIYDLTCFLVGDIKGIQTTLRTFDKGITQNTIGEYLLDANESFVSTVSFANGALGTIHASRWAVGQTNSLRARVYGDLGSIEIDLDRSYDEYRICTGAENIDKAHWDTVHCPPTPSNYERYITAIKTGVNDASDFANGARNQAYLHYSMESDKAGRMLEVA
ncbi:MAG TPA: Gfo/Idh/MocA family oxidoreductase, partial [Anaerolineae bacterium]